MNPGDRLTRDALVAALRERGVGFFAPGDATPASPPLTDGELIEGLAASADPRLRNALAILLLRQPALGAHVPDVVGSAAEAVADVLRDRYTAAVYLQRMWRTRIGIYLPDAPLLPDLFSAQLGLPLPDERFGLVGLHALSDRSTFNQYASYETMVELLFDQLSAEWAHERTSAR